MWEYVGRAMFIVDLGGGRGLLYRTYYGTQYAVPTTAQQVGRRGSGPSRGTGLTSGIRPAPGHPMLGSKWLGKSSSGLAGGTPGRTCIWSLGHNLLRSRTWSTVPLRTPRFTSISLVRPHQVHVAVSRQILRIVRHHIPSITRLSSRSPASGRRKGSCMVTESRPTHVRLFSIAAWLSGISG